jgi:uncharacterized membrane protein YkvA (DUF1232 family)
MKKEKENPDNKILSAVVDTSKPKAEEYLQHPEKAEQLLDTAIEKAEKSEGRRNPLENVRRYLSALIRLFRSYIHHEYTSIPWGSIVLVVAAIVYFVAIVDMMPDFIPGVGYIDDATVIAFVMSRVRSDIDKYLQWESLRGKQQIEKE